MSHQLVRVIRGTLRGYRLAALLSMVLIIVLLRTHHNTPVLVTKVTPPIVFIGGHPRSGTTLLRVMLDVHPKIRCGAETHILPRMLMLLNTLNKPREKDRLIQAKLYPEALHRAYAAFIHTLIQMAGEQAPVLCNKDPFTLKYLDRLNEVVPEAKFILMIRDGRAVVNSLIRRHVRIGPKHLTPKEMFNRWENITWTMLRQCDSVGQMKCLVLRYEDLILRPREQMKEVLRFIGVPWDPIVLKHDEMIQLGTILNKMEPSTSQVRYPINTIPLYSWSWANSTLPNQLKLRAHLTSSILKRLNYPGFPPNYGIADQEVEIRTVQLINNVSFLRTFSKLIR